MYHKIEEIPSPPHSKQWDEMRRWYAPQRNPIESLRLVIPKGLIGCPSLKDVVSMRGDGKALELPLPHLEACLRTHSN